MAAKKRAKQKKQARPASSAKKQTQSTPEAAPEAPPEARTRVIPLASLRATLGIEIDRVRTYGGHTLILRRGRPVAAVIPYHEYERFIMSSNDRNQKEGAGTRMTPAEIMAEVDRVREAIARSDAARAARGLPVNTKSAAELIHEAREERTQQILNAARGKS